MGKISKIDIDKESQELEKISFQSYATYVESKLMLSVLDLKKLVDIVTDMFVELTRVELGYLMLFNEKSCELSVKAVKGLKQEHIKKESSVKTEENIVKWIIDWKKPILLSELDELPVKDFFRRIVEKIGSETILSIPMVTKDKFIGLINLGEKEFKEQFSPKDFKLLFTISSHVAMTIENAKLYEELQNAHTRLQIAKAEVDRKVERRTNQLKKAKEESERANQMKSIFLASMSHELRTPLNSIIGFTGIVLQGFAGELNDEQKKQLGMVYGSAKHLLSLINDLLDISKIETGELKPDIEEFNIAEVGVEIRDSLISKVEEKGLELIFNIPDINIFSDKRRFKQILLNLVNNAIKFTEKGKVKVEAVEKDENIEVIVKDTGPGIKKDDFHKLFHPFVQLKYTISEEAGTGLGLYLTKNLVKLLKGVIQMESEYRKGSTFTFILPIQYGG